MQQQRGRFFFVGGGARSGKSALALRLAEQAGPRRTFLATAQFGDAEMADRIQRHQQERGASFVTIEVPYDLPEAIAGLTRAGPEGCDVVVVDCLTLWLSNLLGADVDDIPERVEALLAAIAGCPADVVLVSNEVGLGIVPMNALARRFRDEAGRAHQRLAAAADEVYFGALGVMLRLKPGPVEAV